MTKTDKRLSLHHIGGRSGSRSFPDLIQFENDFINVIYEADSDCLSQILERNQNRKSELHVLGYCLGETCKSMNLNINYDPYTSSLLEANEDYSSYYSFSNGLYGKYDYSFSESYMTMEQRQVESVTLDYIFAGQNNDLQPPDFLSLDTQGTEYEILLGSKETMRETVLALAVEVGFHRTYKEQRLFGDLCELLSDSGFHFVRFLGLMESSPFRAPLGLRAHGFQLQGDAFFIRRVDAISADQHPDAVIMLKKLAFIAIVFNQFEYGLECLERASQLEVEETPLGLLNQPSYLQFLKALDATVENTPRIFPQTFGTRFTFETSKARFNGSDENPEEAKIKKSTSRITVRLGSITNRFRWSSWLKRKVVRMVTRARLPQRRNSAVEELLIKFGLVEQARILKENRLTQSV